MQFLLMTDQGIEDLVRDELLEKVPGAEAERNPYEFKGHLRVGGVTLDDLLPLRTIHHVIELRGEAEADDLETIRHAVARIDVAEMENAASFRVTSVREGRHPFRHMEIQQVAGAALQNRYGTPVDLEGHALNVRVDLYGHRLIVGVQRTRQALDKRIKRPRPLRTSIKPTLAAAMVRLAGAHRGAGRLIDPMCGSGTIPVEAKQINPGLEVLASDWDEETVETARGTVANHGLDIDVRPCDVRNLVRVFPAPFDHIVTDPPYGVRQARRVDMAALYGSLLPALEVALTGSGKLVIVVLKLRAFLVALESTGLHVVDERLTESGGLHPRIFTLERQGASSATS